MRPARASATARLIAVATVMAEYDADIGLHAPPGAAAWCRRFLSTTRADRVLLASVNSAPGRAGWRLVEHLSLPGIVRHWMRRKRRIESLARSAAGEGFTQLVVIGAGLDSLPFRLDAERVFARIIALDHPATQALVRTALTLAPAQHTHVELVPLNLAHESIAATLAASGAFDPAQSTLLVIEGVLMYLAADEVRTLLRATSALPFPRARLIGTWMDTPPGEPIAFRPQSRLVALWLRFHAESMRWSIPEAALPEFLTGAGWRCLANIAVADPSESQRGPEGERIFVAEKL